MFPLGGKRLAGRQDSPMRLSEMKKKILKIVLIAFLLNGCNYMRTFPLYSEVSVEHPQRIELFTPGIIEVYTGNPDSDNAKAYFRIKERIASYLNEKEDLRGDVADALKNCEVISGMDKEQVTLVLGLPTKKKRLDQTDLPPKKWTL